MQELCHVHRFTMKVVRTFDGPSARNRCIKQVLHDRKFFDDAERYTLHLGGDRYQHVRLVPGAPYQDRLDKPRRVRRVKAARSK